MPYNTLSSETGLNNAKMTSKFAQQNLWIMSNNDDSFNLESFYLDISTLD